MEIKLTPWSPCVSVNLIPLLSNHIQSHIKSGTLIHHSIIPQNEIWVKIGADKGGGSCKCTFQILNVKNPNAKDNTVIFNLFEAQDTYSNLKSALSNNIEQINQLEGLEIVPGKFCRVFFTGDYYGLSTFLGLSGSSAVYFCFYCLLKKGDRNFSSTAEILYHRQLFNILLIIINNLSPLVLIYHVLKISTIVSILHCVISLFTASAHLFYILVLEFLKKYISCWRLHVHI